ncbi:MAG: ATP-binding protein [Rhodoglobus sp.]
MAHYRPRVIDSEMSQALATLGAVIIEGPRGCGKTATGLVHAASAVRLDTDANARELARIDPTLLLEGARPRLIDEWQLEPRLWNSVRREVDEAQLPGQFIFAGSSVPLDDVTRHSGAARFLRVQMRPMSLSESGHSSETVSLRELLRGEPARSRSAALTVPQLVDRLCIGGWPGLQNLPVDRVLRALRSYVADVARIDLPRIDGGERSPAGVTRVIRALARNIATEVTATRLALDAGGSSPMKSSTVARYLESLERVMIVENQESWAPHLRSRDTVRKAPKRHFVDPSLAVAAMGASPAKLLTDLNTLGLLFESLVVRDLRIYSQALDGKVQHFRDESGVEVDAVITLDDGSWAAFEVKLAEPRVDEGAAALLRFAAKVDIAKVGAPQALAVITAGSYAYQRPDGVNVVPISSLAP